MRTKFLSGSFGIIFMFAAALGLRADQVEMQNGDRFSGKVLSVSADTVVLQSETLGKITVLRKKVASLAFGTNTVAAVAASKVPPAPAATNLPPAAALIISGKPNTDLSAALKNSGMDTNFIQQVREQMLGGSPAAASKYDEMVGGLLNGSLNLNDLRREAQSSADQIRQLKRELGPEAGDALDGYLAQLNSFLKETATESTNSVRLPR
ncbi:MAG: hypothetical protein WDM80_12245 [Limisphaerales bacterium]